MTPPWESTHLLKHDKWGFTMKGFVFGAAAAVALSFGFAGVASAGDLGAQCKANAEATEGGDVAAAEAYCGCLVEKSDEATVAELTAIAEMDATDEDRRAKIEAEGSEGAKSALAACDAEAEAAAAAAAAE